MDMFSHGKRINRVHIVMLNSWTNSLYVVAKGPFSDGTSQAAYCCFTLSSYCSEKSIAYIKYITEEYVHPLNLIDVLKSIWRIQLCKNKKEISTNLLKIYSHLLSLFS